MKSVIPAALLLAVLSVSACNDSVRTGSAEHSTETKEAAFSVGGRPIIDVRTGSGSIRVEQGPEGEIALVADLVEPTEIEWSVSQEGNAVLLRATTGSDARADITLSVPVRTRYQLVTDDGDIELSGLSADGIAASGNGSVTLEDLTGFADVTAGNGDTHVTRFTGDLMANSGKGSITVREARGFFNLFSGEGSIELAAAFVPGSTSALNAGIGNITVEFIGTPNSILDLEIEGDGRMRATALVEGSSESDRRLTGTLGNGQSSLRIHTRDGDIVLK